MRTPGFRDQRHLARTRSGREGRLQLVRRSGRARRGHDEYSDEDRGRQGERGGGPLPALQAPVTNRFDDSSSSEQARQQTLGGRRKASHDLLRGQAAEEAGQNRQLVQFFATGATVPQVPLKCRSLRGAQGANEVRA